MWCTTSCFWCAPRLTEQQNSNAEVRTAQGICNHMPTHQTHNLERRLLFVLRFLTVSEMFSSYPNVLSKVATRYNPTGGLSSLIILPSVEIIHLRLMLG